MAVDSNTSISAADYNNLQSRIDQLLGVGSGNFGYGQSVSSSQVVAITDVSIPNGDSVTAQQLNNLLTDFDKAHTHQNGVSLGISSFSAGDIVGADASGTDITYDDQGNTTILNEDDEKGYNDFLNIIQNLENNRFQIANNQSNDENVLSDTRSRDWNDSILSEFTVTFSSADERRHFFNAGGEIRFSGSVDLATSTGVSLSRDQGWKDMIENVSLIKFNHNSTVETGGAAGVSFPSGVIGNYQLTTSYQTIFRKDANSGTYSNSYWTIEAKENNAQSISFRVTLIDLGPESDTDTGAIGGVDGGIQEPVTADITFSYGYLKANGEVVIATPSFNLVEDFELDLTNDIYVAIPTNQSPSNGSTEYTNTRVSLQSSAFNVINGSDTHEATQWYLKKVSDDSTILLDESTTELTSYLLDPDLFSDVIGTNEEYEWQVRYKGTTYGWTPWSTPTSFTSSIYAGFDITIDSDTQDFDLFEELTSTFNWNTTQLVEGTVTINSGIYVGASNPSTIAFNVDNIPSSSNIAIVNNGAIIGAGGAGGFAVGSSLRDGSPGGIALRLTAPVTITNGSGQISGGGGGGGAALVARRDGSEVFSAGGGGGAGYNFGAGGNVPGSDGTAGTRTTGGAGGSESGDFTVTTSTSVTFTASGSTTGGTGGNPGQNGSAGTSSLSTRTPESPTDSVSAGGAAGNAIVGSSNITWISGSGNVSGPTS